MTGHEPADSSLVDRILKAACNHLQMDAAYVSEITPDAQIVRFATGKTTTLGLDPGSKIPLEETYCDLVVAGHLPNVVPDTTAEPLTRDLPPTEAIGAYIGVPVHLSSGHVYGTLCCASAARNETLGRRDIQFLNALAELIADEIDASVATRRDLESALNQTREAIEGNDLSVSIQPIVDLTDGAVVGVESLARFSDGDSPESWFSAAEALGLGSDLERAAIRRAIEVLENLPEGVYLSVNASPQVLVDPGIADLLLDLPTGRITVEVTEHAKVSDYGALRLALKPLRDKGMKLAIDDAGAGFASFRHVIELRPDILKLDVSLTHDIASDSIQRALAEKLVAFAAEIDASIVAEGIESAESLAMLRDLGVNCGQGFFFGDPEPPPLRVDIFTFS